jgi:aryl-phospho-beta-D-glucosidase BglC (GH1 family)
LPGDPYYTEQLFIDDWVMLARRYRNTAVVAADLWNEPKMNSTWGTGDLASDWRLAAERVGNAIQAVNPDWLLVVEGVGGATWWGGNFLINYSPTGLHCTSLNCTIHFETIRPPSSSNQGT